MNHSKSKWRESFQALLEPVSQLIITLVLALVAVSIAWSTISVVGMVAFVFVAFSYYFLAIKETDWLFAQIPFLVGAGAYNIALVHFHPEQLTSWHEIVSHLLFFNLIVGAMTAYAFYKRERNTYLRYTLWLTYGVARLSARVANILGVTIIFLVIATMVGNSSPLIAAISMSLIAVLIYVIAVNMVLRRRL